MSVSVVTRYRGGFSAIQRADGAVGDIKNRGMHEGWMIAVAFVLQDEFPVSLDAMLQKPRCHLDLAFGRGADQTIDCLSGAAEMLLKRWAFGGERAKHEA